MHYLGGKFRLRKPISEIINKYYEPNRTFVSLFCGSCNVESLVNFDNIILNDKHEYLIAMWKDFFNGREFTNKISREEYYYIKEHCKDDKGLYGLVGFGSSFSGKFWSSYATSNKKRNYLNEAIRGNIKITNNLKKHNTILLNKDYKEVEIPINSVVYCFDKDTEVLTKSGWKLFKDVDISTDLFLSREPNTGNIEWVKANYKTQYKYNGKMFHYTGKHIDLCITDNHNFYYAKNYGRKQHKTEIIDKVSNINFNGMRYFVKAGGKWAGEQRKYFDICGQQISALPFARLLGIFITDGSVSKQGNITISQTKPKIIKIIKELLNQTQIEYSFYSSNNDNGKTFYIHRKYLPYFQQFYLKETQHVPEDIKNSSIDILKAFIEGVLDGDSDNERRKIYTGSKSLADDYQEILYKIGLASNLSTYKPKKSYLKAENRYIQSKKEYYAVSVLKTKYPLIIKDNILWEYYNDMVYCVTLDKWHTVLTRRNGKTVWMGQCDPPYFNTTKYSKGMSIDYTEFWDYMRELSKSNIVFISEEQAPDDFISIFEKQQQRTVDRNKDNIKISTEKLFVHKTLINKIKEV